ncbi:MAG TPA: hypothetical protein VLH18_02495 [Candidatus Limnocylindrales bacterium]|nr:hypothetical protein [Candidatus Limnocylindrales bacterium]
MSKEMPFSSMRRHFCPSCHQKRVVEYGEWLLLASFGNIALGVR